jgi:hypothetical protein
VTRTLRAAMSAKFLRRLSMSLLATLREAVGKVSTMRGELHRFSISTSSEFPFLTMTRESLPTAIVAIGLKFSAHRVIVRNPVAAKRIKHTSANVKASENAIHEFLPCLHNATSLERLPGSLWMGYQDVQQH